MIIVPDSSAVYCDIRRREECIWLDSFTDLLDQFTDDV